ALRAFWGLLFPYGFVAGPVALIGLVAYGGDLWRLPAFRFSLFTVIIGLLIAVGVSLHTPVLEGRTLAIFALPVMVMIVLCFTCFIEAVTRLWPDAKGAPAYLALAVVLALTIWGSAEKSWRDVTGWRNAAQVMLSQHCSGKSVLTNLRIPREL